MAQCTFDSFSVSSALKPHTNVGSNIHIMKARTILLIVLNTFCFYSYGQDKMDVKNFDQLLTYISDTTEFWNEIEQQVKFPKMCVEIYASEKLEISVIKQDDNELKFLVDSQNPLFGKEAKKIENIFKKYITEDCNSIDMKFYVHFDLEPWYYPNYNDKKTNGGHLYSHKIIVIQQYMIPFIMSGG